MDRFSTWVHSTRSFPILFIPVFGQNTFTIVKNKPFCNALCFNLPMNSTTLSIPRVWQARHGLSWRSQVRAMKKPLTGRKQTKCERSDWQCLRAFLVKIKLMHTIDKDLSTYVLRALKSAKCCHVGSENGTKLEIRRLKVGNEPSPLSLVSFSKSLSPLCCKVAARLCHEDIDLFLEG